jgi:acyl-coenzyme A synthetase/AMP-(fatty) acid ligase
MTAGIPGGPADLRHVTTGPVLDGVKLALEPVPEPDPADEGAVPMRLLPEAGFRGYCDPATGALLAPAPQFWSTSDLVRLHDGPGGSWIEVMGRTDHAVNRDGLLVHLAQVEGCLARARGVAQAAVAPAGQTRRGIGLTAFVTLSAPGASEPEAIQAHCRGELQPRAVPDVVYILDEMPMLASGKIDRKRLAALAAEKLAASTSGG